MALLARLCELAILLGICRMFVKGDRPLLYFRRFALRYCVLQKRRAWCEHNRPVSPAGRGLQSPLHDLGEMTWACSLG